MANSENVIPYGELVHEAAVHGGPDAFLKDFGLALLEDAYPIIFGEGYEVGDMKGFRRGVLVTSAVGAGIVAIWQAVDKLPKLYRRFKKKEHIEKTNCENMIDTDTIERLLHLDELLEKIIESTEGIVAYKVNGKVVKLRIKAEDDEYESEIVFMNNGSFNYSTFIENDYVTLSIARKIENLLKNKSCSIPDNEWIEVRCENDKYAEKLQSAIAEELKRN